ncbi:MAG: tetratricopeptide repeat protein [Candidatus Omnitrophica bacterium]|nr:tetratricopeptide repeat protein [Candidatus Omnitrophota bacterium]
MRKKITKPHLPHWAAVCALALAGIIAYHNCLNNAMFWDDDDFILKNRYIKDWQYFPKFFSENLVAGGYLLSNYWRPVLLTVFAWAWHIWHTWLPGWHSLNIAFHILDGILLYFLFNRLFANRILSAIAALIFTTHPVHNEAIVYVNSLGDPLAAFFVLSSLLLFARFRQSGKPAYASRNFWFAFLLYPLAIMSKETGFVLCGLLPAMDFLLLQTNASCRTRVKNTLSAAWPFLAIAVIYVILRGTALNFSDSFNFYHEQNEFTGSIFIRVLTFFKAAAQYTGFLFFPYELRVERQMPWAHSLLEGDVLLGGLIITAMAIALFKYWKKDPLLSFAFAWFFIAIAPASNVLVPINAVIYEHFLYMPMIGITLATVNAALRLVEQKNIPRPGAAALVLILAVFCAINVRRNTDWRTAIGFYEQLVQYAPSYRVINNLGMEYANKGIHDKAEFWYKKAIAMDPANPVAYHNIAGTYRDTGRLALAEANFKKAITLNPKFIFSYRSLAELYWRLGDFAQAKKYLITLVNFDPQDQNARQALQTVDNLIKQNRGGIDGTH